MNICNFILVLFTSKYLAHRAYCKRFFELLQTVLFKISDAREGQEQDIVRSYVHLLHSISPAPTELLVEVTRRRSLLDRLSRFLHL
jgi:hypothetical protein